ncbi:50S ribosomal protein L18 [Patescibacteria group bacterium]|nr:50S ribosomal protein L18 [Patescibacteria group bacterium]
MLKKKIKINKRQIRQKRVKAKISGTKERPRLSVFRSNKYIYVQLVNDQTGKKIVHVNEKELNPLANGKSTKIERSYQLGELLAKKALDNKIKKVVFDRGGYKYHGRVKALADGARKGGLQF